MLVFSRKRGDAVAMGDPRGGDHVLKVTVLGIYGSQVKLGFEAASHIAVHRWEVWQRIRGENGAIPPPAAALKNSTDGQADDGGRWRTTPARPQRPVD